MSAAIEALVPELQTYARALMDVASRAGFVPVVTSTIRTHAQQGRLYARYLAGRNPFPVAFPGTSAHEYGEAFDMITRPSDDGAQSDLGQVWQSWGGTWGGARDPVHFELPGASDRHRHPTIAAVADFVLGLAPGIGEVELAAWLASFGFPNSEILQFLQSPLTYTQRYQ